MPEPINAVNRTQPATIASTGQGSPAATPGGPAAQPAPSAVDSADIGRAESLLATISTAAAAVPATDPSRVAELQRAILSGAYQIDPQQIAERFIEIEQLLAAAGKIG